MNFLKTVAAVLALVLVLQTGCDLWCHHADSEVASSLETSGAPACHDTTEKSEGSEQTPTRNHESSKDCVHPQAADGNSKLQTRIVQASQPAIFDDLPGVHDRSQLYAVPSGSPNKNPLKVSPPSSSILRI